MDRFYKDVLEQVIYKSLTYLYTMGLPLHSSHILSLIN